eukprot:11416334-Karenia_brevis.AAC.1
MCIRDSCKYDALEICQPGNLGPPAAMMITVGNVHTGQIVAHVNKGPFVSPDPEETYKHLTKSVKFNGVTQNAVVVQQDLRRRLLLERRFYSDKHD